MDMTSFLLGYKSGLKSGGGSSSGSGDYNTEFLAETTFTNSVQSFDDANAFAYFVPVEAEAMRAWATNSKPVTVVYDGEEYSLTPQTINYTDDIVGVCVGNLTLFGGTGNNEPFAVASWQNDDTEPGLLFVSTVDTAPTQHAVHVYQKKSCKLVEGSFDATSSVQVIEHGCGEVPDIFVLRTAHAPQEGEVFFSVGFSQALFDALGGGYLAENCVLAPGGSISLSSSVGIEGVDDMVGFAPRLATSETITVGGEGNLGLVPGKSYCYFCICGIV